MSNPFIQIDNEVREMTDDEYAAYLEMINQIKPLEADNDN